MKNDVLKTLALRAKNRLINKNNGNEEIPQKSDFRIKIIKSGDEVFYDKVKSILEREDNVLNPIKELMDEELLSNMTNSEREKYLLDTVDKFTKVKRKLEYEKELKVVY